MPFHLLRALLFLVHPLFFVRGSYSVMLYFLLIVFHETYYKNLLRSLSFRPPFRGSWLPVHMYPPLSSLSGKKNQPSHLPSYLLSRGRCAKLFSLRHPKVPA